MNKKNAWKREFSCHLLHFWCPSSHLCKSFQWLLQPWRVFNLLQKGKDSKNKQDISLKFCHNCGGWGVSLQICEYYIFANLRSVQSAENLVLVSYYSSLTQNIIKPCTLHNFQSSLFCSLVITFQSLHFLSWLIFSVTYYCGFLALGYHVLAPSAIGLMTPLS